MASNAKIVNVLALVLLTVGPTAFLEAQDCRDWVLRASSGPTARYGGAMAYDSVRHVTVLHGGSGENDTWEWDGNTWSQRSNSGPTTRGAMAYDEARAQVIYYGNIFSGTWSWDGATWELRDPNGPNRPSGGTMAYDPTRQVIMLVSKVSEGLSTWEWDGSHWTWRSTESQPSWDRGLAFDRRRGVMVMLCGGGGGDEAYTWEWAGTHWALCYTGGPNPREQFAMAYDEALGVTVLFGGEGASYYNDTWEWDGTHWEAIAISGPAARALSMMAYDSGRQALVLFGGYDNMGHAFDDTWELVSLVVLSSPDSQGRAVGEPVSFHAEFDGIAPIDYRWHRNGQPLADDGRITGTATLTLSISHVRLIDEGTYDLVATNLCGSVVTAPATLGITTPLGDLNCDGVLNFDDINPFVLALASGTQYAEQYPNCDRNLADCNADGYVDFDDINPFVAILSG